MESTSENQFTSSEKQSEDVEPDILIVEDINARKTVVASDLKVTTKLNDDNIFTIASDQLKTKSLASLICPVLDYDFFNVDTTK